MAEKLTLNAEIREGNGTGKARELRRQGWIPAVIYGGKSEEVKISVEQKPLLLAYQKGGFRSQVIEIKTPKGAIQVLPREIQFHPVTDMPLHADFLRVTSDHKFKIKVKVNFRNKEKSPGIKRGGILNIVRREIELWCDASNIPESLEVDLDGLQIGQSVHISAIKLPEGVMPTIKGRNFTVATIAGRQKEEEEIKPVAAEAAEGAEGAEGAEATAPAKGAAPAKGTEAAPAKKK